MRYVIAQYDNRFNDLISQMTLFLRLKFLLVFFLFWKRKCGFAMTMIYIQFYKLSIVFFIFIIKFIKIGTSVRKKNHTKKIDDIFRIAGGHCWITMNRKFIGGFKKAMNETGSEFNRWMNPIFYITQQHWVISFFFSHLLLSLWSVRFY